MLTLDQKLLPPPEPGHTTDPMRPVPPTLARHCSNSNAGLRTPQTHHYTPLRIPSSSATSFLHVAAPKHVCVRERGQIETEEGGRGGGRALAIATLPPSAVTRRQGAGPRPSYQSRRRAYSWWVTAASSPRDKPAAKQGAKISRTRARISRARARTPCVWTRSF